MTWIWWAPFTTAVLHIGEEFFYPGGFATWDRSYRPQFQRSITSRFHVFINVALLLLCAQVGLLAGSTEREAQLIGIPLWLAVAALLFSNAVFHGVGTLRTRTYSPGVVTALALYVPLAVLGYWHFLHNGQVTLLAAAAAAIAGGSYHFWARLLHKARARGPIE